MRRTNAKRRNGTESLLMFREVEFNFPAILLRFEEVTERFRVSLFEVLKRLFSYIFAIVFVPFELDPLDLVPPLQQCECGRATIFLPLTVDPIMPQAEG